jgi:uncharacterized protein YegL
MSNQRKLDVFILIDISGSMTGEPIEALNFAIQASLNLLYTNPLADNRLRICIQTYNRELYEIHQLEHLESLIYNFKSLGFAEGPTNSGDAIKKTLTKIKQTKTEFSNYDLIFKNPLLIHITDGFPSDVAGYNEIIEKLNREKINKIGCGFGLSADLKSLKDFSKTVIVIEKNDRDSIIQFSQALSSIILFYLFSEDDDPDVTAIFDPTKPNNPILKEKIKLI